MLATASARSVLQDVAVAVEAEAVDADPAGFRATSVMIQAVTWLGVDVGGERKGFDAALIDERGVLDLKGGLTHAEILVIVRTQRPAVVAIDSPRCCAPQGERTRAGERRVHNEICGIRWTPDASQLHGNPYYAWIEHGLELYRALEGCGAEVIEVFPTASWTRWAGKRGHQSRSQWSSQALARLGLEGVPSRTNQDERDAIAAAVTAREHSQEATEELGEIVVPAEQSRPRATGWFEPTDKATLPLMVAVGRLVLGAAVLEKTLHLELARVHYERAIESGDPAGYGLDKALADTEQLTSGQARSKLEALGLPETLNARIRSAVDRRNALLHRPMEDAALARAVGTGEGLDVVAQRIERLALDCGELGVELERFAGDRLAEMVGMTREQMARLVVDLDVSTIADRRMRAQLEAVKASGIDLTEYPYDTPTY